MINAILKGLLSMLQTIVNIILTPINALISGIFPDFSNLISNFTNFVNNYIGGSLGWFSSLLPPITRSIIVFWLTFLVGYYSIAWGYRAVVLAWKLIQKIKFW